MGWKAGWISMKLTQSILITSYVKSMMNPSNKHGHPGQEGKAFEQV